MSKQKKQTSQPTNKQVANSNIGYQGVVTITTYKGKQRKSSFSQKNAGKASLFNFLVNCLSGQLEENNRPNFIRLLGIDPNNQQPQPKYISLTSHIKAAKIATEPAIEPNNDSAANITYSFLVPYSMLQTTNTKMYIYKAQLLNNTTDTSAQICAQADISVPDGFERPALDRSKPDYSLVIDWKLSIANKETTTT